VVPVQLGCCPEPPYCLLCARRDHAPTPELVEALVEHTRELRGDERPLRLRFFGGPPPSPALVEACRGLPFDVRVRPDLLSRDDAERLAASGCGTIELDALCLDDVALHVARRPYRAALVLEILGKLPSLGLSPGVVLAPGMPRTSHDSSVADARRLAPLVDTARLHPVLVLQHSALQQLHMADLYEPLTVPQAVSLCRDLLEIFEAHGVAVLRIGQNPGADELGRCVAGPDHSSLRELIEAQRAQEAVRELLGAVPRGAHAVVRCAPADEARTRGPLHDNVRTLRAEFGLAELTVVADAALQRGMWRVEEAT
jgi:hypothetical protein